MFGRLSQRKEDYLVSMKLTKIGAQVDNDCTVQLKWTRGPQSDSTRDYEMNDVQTEVVDWDNGPEVFQRVTSMWSKDGKSFEPKKCDFQLFMTVTEGKKQVLIGEKKGYDFAPFVGQTGQKDDVIQLENNKFPDTYIVVRWDIQLSKSTKTQQDNLRQSVLRTSAQGGSTSVVGAAAELASVLSDPEKIKELLERGEELENENKNLDKSVEIYMKTKESLQKSLSSISKERDQLKNQVADLGGLGKSKVVKVTPLANEEKYLEGLANQDLDAYQLLKKELEDMREFSRQEQAKLQDEIKEVAAKRAEDKKQLEQVKFDEVSLLNTKFEEMTRIHHQSEAGEQDQKNAAILQEKHDEITALKKQINEIKLAQAEAGIQTSSLNKKGLTKLTPHEEFNLFCF